MHIHSNETDDTLMARLAGDHLEAAAVLFRRYNAGLFNFFLRMGFARDAAEDMVQTVFERLIKYRHTYRADMPFRAWLYQIARNVRADERARNTRFAGDSTLLENLETTWMELPVQQALEAQETLVQLEKAMRYLPEDQLEILLLTRYQRLKYVEVGALLNCSEAAVKVRVYRALQQLRDIFFKLEAL